MKLEEIKRKINAGEMFFIEEETLPINYMEVWFDKKTNRIYKIFYKINTEIDTVEEIAGDEDVMDAKQIVADAVAKAAIKDLEKYKKMWEELIEGLAYVNMGSYRCPLEEPKMTDLDYVNEIVEHIEQIYLSSSEGRPTKKE